MKGFRLERFEVFNWGTFNQQIWPLDVQRQNALVTGDIGSGKSTLLDGLTTLLVSPQRFTYNKAAGGEHRERDRRSYVLGHYKSDNNSISGAAKPVALRDTKQHSVLLAIFASDTEQVTLAQVYWFTDQQGQPDRLLVVSDGRLSIKDHFTQFQDIATLRKRLRDMQGLKVHETFTSYSDDFRRRLGIPGEQAMTLFAQTVSMKEAGQLTDFVREHMLDPCDVQGRIDELLANFDVLQQAHQKVIDAREQIEQLEPLAANIASYDEKAVQISRWQAEKLAIPGWFAEQKETLVKQQQGILKHDLSLGQERLKGITAEIDREGEEQRRLAIAIAQAGGRRIEDLKRDVKDLQDELTRRTEAASDYRTFATLLNLPVPETDESFHAQHADVVDRHRQSTQAGEELIAKRVTCEHELAQLISRDDAIRIDALSLAERPNNIDSKRIVIRQQLCQDLQISPERLPFAGELIRVIDNEIDWEGAIERVLGGFAGSLLIPGDLQDAVREWVNTHHLGLRLFLYRYGAVARIPASSRLNSLVRKVEVKQSEAHDWVRAELAARFDYACCDTPAECHRMGRGVTRLGYVSHNETRSEKDDRSPIGDRTRYQLGWSSREKIAELQRRREALHPQLKSLKERLAQLKTQHGNSQNEHTALQHLVRVKAFAKIDVASIAAQIETKTTEIRRLEESDNTLKELNGQLTQSTARLTDLKAKEQAQSEAGGQIKEKLSALTHILSSISSIIEGITPALRAEFWPHFSSQEHDPLSLPTIDSQERKAVQKVDQDLAKTGKEMTRLSGELIKAMGDFCHKWPIEAQELDANLAAAPAYVLLLKRLQDDGLPAFIDRFRILLHEHTFRGMAEFKHALDVQEEDIDERISLINLSLKTIEYGRDFGRSRYIQLVKSDEVAADIMEFKRDLRNCFQNVLGNSTNDENERKFEQIRALIIRLRGDPKTAEADARWRARVTDVRNWFVFGASERWLDTNDQHEFHPGSSGKSGGQKEKLAYTVLAASLAFQYRIHDADRSRNFRFVIIDEAFGKGSDESVRYGLELFAKLDLQLLIATPLQKIAPIEPFVSSVSYVHNLAGKDSRIRHLTVAEVRAMRTRRA